MASDAEREVESGASPAGKAEGEEEVVTVELPAPQGWTKKYTPKKSGTRRSEICFISPTGEEIKNKRQLDQYLRSHPGGPPSSEFDWGTGDTPRRSVRISEKAKATESPETEPPKKRERKSSTKKGAKKDTTNGEDVAFEEEGAGEAEAKKNADVEMKDAEGGNDRGKEKVQAGETKEGAQEIDNDGEKEKVPADETKEEAQGTGSDGGKEKNPADETKEDAQETAEQYTENKNSDSVEEEMKEDGAEENADAEKAIKDDDSAAHKEDKAQNEKSGNDSEVLPPPSEYKPEKNAADAENKDGVTAPDNDSQKDKEEEAPKSSPSLNCNDGQRQPEAASVSC